MIAICSHCESRLSVPRLGSCRPCKSAHKALDDYWRSKDMPLAWAEKERRIWLPAIRVGAVAA